MTVAVMGASGLVGPPTVRALVRRFPEVRAYVRRPEAAEPLRALGAKVATGTLEDRGALEAVLSGAFTVCHLIGSQNEPDDESYGRQNLETVSVVLEEAVEAGIKRIVFLSTFGASVDAAHPYLRSKGEAEERIRASGLEFAIVRAAPVYGIGGFWFAAMVDGAQQDPPEVVGEGLQTLAPLFVDDVAEVLAAADDRAGDVRGTWGLEGPERLTADELIAVLAGDSRRPVHLGTEDAAGRLTDRLGRPVSVSACELLEMAGIADAPDAATEFGVAKTSLREGLRGTLERAAAAGLEG